MPKGRTIFATLLLATSALALPQAALAGPVEDRLEARLADLEAQVNTLRSDLAAEHAANAQLAATAQAASQNNKARLRAGLWRLGTWANSMGGVMPTPPRR